MCFLFLEQFCYYNKNIPLLQELPSRPKNESHWSQRVPPPHSSRLLRCCPGSLCLLPTVLLVTQLVLPWHLQLSPECSTQTKFWLASRTEPWLMRGLQSWELNEWMNPISQLSFVRGNAEAKNPGPMFPLVDSPKSHRVLDNISPPIQKEGYWG